MTIARVPRALGVATALAAATLFTTWGLLFYRPLPTIDGHYRLLGLHERGEVIRDVFGIPRIYARDTHDLFFLQGYVTAQDRFAEMEAMRAWARSVRIDLPQNSAREPSKTVSLALDAYAAGVNKFLGQHSEARALPGELVLAGRRPRPWSTDDSAFIAMAHFGRPGPSLCIAVDASASRSGRPLLAAELHADAPSRGWYEIGLSGGAIRAVGLSLPGVPGILAGHNGWSAWAAFPDGRSDVYGAFIDLLDAAVAQPYMPPDAPRDLACHTRRSGIAGEPARVERARALTAQGKSDLDTLRTALGRPQGPSGGRLVVDLADVDTSRSAVSHGASGHRSSPHYDDQKALWEIGQTHRLPFTRGAIGRTDGELVLRAR